MLINSVIDLRRFQPQTADFCQRNNILKLSVFRSVLRSDFTSESDIDLLVEFDSERIPGLIALAGMELELGELFQRKVDIRTTEDLSLHFRQNVLDSALLPNAIGRRTKFNPLLFNRLALASHSTELGNSAICLQLMIVPA